jgi:ubiquinone/menaquinone biosynthesis C-methylase UbiE
VITVTSYQLPVTNYQLPMQRILEPEVMDGAQEAAEYDGMDFTEVNTAFAELATHLAPSDPLQVLDVGTGTARIPLILAQLRPQWQITGVDLAKSMLTLGQKNIMQAGLQAQIVLEIVDGKQMPYAVGQFDLVMSNSLVHHLPDPLPFFQEVRRVLKPTGALLLRDLLRPPNEETMEAMVAEVGSDYDEHQTRLFRDSLQASFRLDEIQNLVDQAGLDELQVYQSSDRHWTAQRASMQ